MASSLTISLALYLFLIILPGYISLFIAGYPVSEKGSVYKIIIRGAVIFLLVTEIILTYFDGTKLAIEYLNILKNGNLISGRYLLGIVGIMFVTGVVMGCIQLLFDFRFVWFTKKEMKRLIPSNNKMFEVCPGDSLKKIFTCYRIANIRPLVKVKLGVNNGETICGEVLKFNWNGSEHLLIKETDSQEIIWLELENCGLIQFMNIERLVKPSLKEKSNVKDIRKERGEILELIHTGLSKDYLDENGNIKNFENKKSHSN